MISHTLHFDGSCGPKNPGGTAAYGFALYRTGEQEPYKTGHGIIGTGSGMTNNLAEFHALAAGLRDFYEDHKTQRSGLLTVYGDSNLVIQIMNGVWRARPGKAYYEAYETAMTALMGVRRLGIRVTLDWVPRGQNAVADGLSR